MKGDKLIYFFNCYFLMLDYDESLEEIVKSYMEKENDNNAKLLLEDLKYIFEEDNKENEYLDHILENSDEMNVDKLELKEIIKEVYTEFMKYDKK